MSKRLNETVNTLKPILFLLILLFSNLSVAGYSDEIGNLFKTKEQTDRQCGRAGQLLKDETYSYSYDEVGNLIEKESITEKWRYQWSQGGMLKKVIRPDKKHVDFTYDALGRRLTKSFEEETTHFVWDGNTPLHEWTSSVDETISFINDKGEKELKIPENLTTWIFEDGTFIPMAKLEGGNSYSIITDHLGTPTEAYDEEGKKVWSRELNIYGETRKETGTPNFVPFKYQGQIFDEETGLCYNRYRYYSPESGTYISQDPIGLDGQMPNMYSYVHDLNAWIDPFGLDYFRGSKNGDLNFTPKPNEYKIDKSTGLVKNTHGVSLFDNTGSITKNGFTPNKVDMSTVSDKLQIKQRGNDLKHFEIMPKNNMPLDEYKAELSKIKCT